MKLHVAVDSAIVKAACRSCMVRHGAQHRRSNGNAERVTQSGPAAAAAPATVSGERAFITTGFSRIREGNESATTREPGDQPCGTGNQLPGMAALETR